VYGAPRLLWKNPEAFRVITPEVGDHWGKLMRLHDSELGGYFHLWHVKDPHLGEFPWHGTEWEHAGGYDTEFLSHWPKERQKYLNMEVLHLGSPFSGWYGRVKARPLRKGTTRWKSRHTQRSPKLQAEYKVDGGEGRWTGGM
jgi:hypothetical protein